MLRALALSWILAAAANAIGPAEVIRFVESKGYSHYAHIRATVRVGQSEAQSGWLILARQDEGKGPYIALMLQSTDEESGESLGVTTHLFGLHGIAHRLRDYLFLRSSTQQWANSALLTELILDIDPVEIMQRGRPWRTGRYSITQARGVYEILGINSRSYLNFDMQQVRNDSRRGLCSFLIIRAYSILEGLRK